jgi:hypothetical protein
MSTLEICQESPNQCNSCQISKVLGQKFDTHKVDTIQCKRASHISDDWLFFILIILSILLKGYTLSSFNVILTELILTPSSSYRQCRPILF